MLFPLSQKIYYKNLNSYKNIFTYIIIALFALISILSQVRCLTLPAPGASAEELSDTENLPSTARPATSHSQSRAAGPTRAIARTQQSERVRASVNRHRITQARTSQVWHEA